jgi:hypothetical protein
MDYKGLLDDALEETGIDLNVSKDELKQYVAERALHLTSLAGDPDFAVALRAERDAVALHAGLNATMQATAADSRIVGIIQTILMRLV